MRRVLTANNRSVPVFSFPRSVYRRNGTRLKRKSESVNDLTKVFMIGHLILFTEEGTSSSKSILRYTLTSTAYLAIGRTESAFCTTCARTKRGQAPYFLMRKRTFANTPDKSGHFFFTSRLKNTPGLLKGSNTVFRKEIVLNVSPCGWQLQIQKFKTTFSFSKRFRYILEYYTHLLGATEQC